MVLVDLFSTIERPETTPMRWAESGADEDGRALDREREREREREKGRFLARQTAVVSTIDRNNGGAVAWSWSTSFRLLRDQRPRPCGGPSLE